MHRTHTGEIVTGARLAAARDKVANDWVALANGIRFEDAYADHVSEERKIKAHMQDLDFAEGIRNGHAPIGFTIWQRINTELTGECVALLH